MARIGDSTARPAGRAAPTAFREGDRTGSGPGRQRLRPAIFPCGQRGPHSSRDKIAVPRRPPLRCGRSRPGKPFGRGDASPARPRSSTPAKAAMGAAAAGGRPHDPPFRHRPRATPRRILDRHAPDRTPALRAPSLPGRAGRQAAAGGAQDRHRIGRHANAGGKDHRMAHRGQNTTMPCGRSPASTGSLTGELASSVSEPSAGSIFRMCSRLLLPMADGLSSCSIA